MKKIIITLMLCSIAGMAAAQSSVSNIKVQQSDSLLTVTYKLTEKADIEAYVSFDNGLTFRGPLQHVSGSIGKGQSPDKNKKFVWNIVKEVGYVDYPNTIIKIVAIENPVVKIPKEKSEKTPATEYPPFYVAISAGKSTFGTISFGKITSGGPGVLGIDVAYFFNPNLGAGLKLNVGQCEVDFKEFIYNETITFCGPSLYGRWGKGRLAFTAGAGVGWLNWQYEMPTSGSAHETTAGVFLSAGLNYMISQNVGIGFNLQSVLGSLSANDVSRNPAGLGATVGINFRF